MRFKGLSRLHAVQIVSTYCSFCFLEWSPAILRKDILLRFFLRVVAKAYFCWLIPSNLKTNLRSEPQNTTSNKHVKISNSILDFFAWVFLPPLSLKSPKVMQRVRESQVKHSFKCYLYMKDNNLSLVPTSNNENHKVTYFFSKLWPQQTQYDDRV